MASRHLPHRRPPVSRERSKTHPRADGARKVKMKVILRAAKNLRRQLIAVAALIAIGLTLAASTAASAADHPNIVLIYADDLGYGDTSCYGATAVQTPNIDRLAREGLR